VNLQASDVEALGVSLRLATVTVLCLLLLGTPLAWWLARTHSRLKPVVEGLVGLPLVLPPSVLGFYLLLFLGARGPLAPIFEGMNVESLAFSFTGLVIGSIVFSLPFVVQPLHNSFAAIDLRLLEVAATMGAKKLDRFFTVVLPLTRAGWIRAATLGFAHTLGEFGVVLMIGGNLAGETRVASIAIYNHVETLNYERAHHLAGVLLVLSLVLMVLASVLTRDEKGPHASSV
jgi:molybdate transport system permease protein